MKKHLREQVLFQLNPPPAEEIHLWWVKSLRDEIPLRGNKGGGFDFICEADFIRAYICEANCSDFIVLRTISLRTYELHFCTMTTMQKRSGLPLLFCIDMGLGQRRISARCKQAPRFYSVGASCPSQREMRCEDFMSSCRHHLESKLNHYDGFA